MYKYKKTVIINNRRRRIFSKEKSNTEYILYKKEYITLNAYNKKTGGGLGNLLNRKLYGEQNEFEIPYRSMNINFNDKRKYNDNIDNYDKNISDDISNYLKITRLIPPSNNKIWIIVNFQYNFPIKVKGYTEDEWNNYVKKRNSETELKDYGEKMHKQMFKLYTIDYNKNLHDVHCDSNGHKTYTKKIINNDNVADFLIKFKTDYYTYISNNFNNEKFLYYYYLANNDGLNVYDVLKKNGYYIYYILKNVEKDDYYIVDTNYNLYNTLFKCKKISEHNASYGSQQDTKVVYDISFEYIGNAPTSTVATVGGQRKYKNLKYKKSL